MSMLIRACITFLRVWILADGNRHYSHSVPQLQDDLRHRSFVITAPGTPRHSKPAARAVFGGARTAFSSGLLGFIAGVVFWHFIGFWEFVSKVVFRGPEQPAIFQSGAARQLPGVNTNCTSLAKDEQSGFAASSQCLGDAAAGLAMSNTNLRADKLGLNQSVTALSK